MKKILTIALIGSVISALGFLALMKKPVVYEKEVEKIVTEEITIDELDERIKNALAASSTEIEVRAKNAYQVAKEKAELEVQLNVTAQYRKEIEEKEKDLMDKSVF